MAGFSCALNCNPSIHHRPFAKKHQSPPEPFRNSYRLRLYPNREASWLVIAATHQGDPSVMGGWFISCFDDGFRGGRMRADFIRFEASRVGDWLG